MRMMSYESKENTQKEDKNLRVILIFIVFTQYILKEIQDTHISVQILKLIAQSNLVINTWNMRV